MHTSRAVAGGTPCENGGDTTGFSAAELLVVITVLGIVATTYMALQRPPEAVTMEIAAHRLALEVERVREEAAASEGEGLIAIRPDGRFAVQTGAAGSVSLGAIPADAWEELGEGLAWGSGEANKDPFGREPQALPAQVFCDAEGCTPPPGGAAYFVRSQREGHRVAAVTLDAAGAVQVWRWEPGSGGWTALAR